MTQTSTNLSQNEYTCKELLRRGATTSEIADTLDISPSYVYDLIQSLRDKGLPVSQNQHGEYFLTGQETDSTLTAVQTRRQTSGEKATITRRTNKFLSELEYQLVDRLNGTEPAVADGGLFQRDGAADFILHCTDDHFGEVVENQYGDEVFNTDIAEGRVWKRFEEAIARAEEWSDMGVEFDTAHLLLGGDLVTNENIYDGQADDIEANLTEQIERAAEVYVDGIKWLARRFPSVQVVPQVGNHGRLEGADANADNILYMMIDRVVRESSLDNVTFLSSAQTYFIDFEIRDWNAHLRHGHDSSLEHIGTSAGKQRWLTWLHDHDFEVAFRGHYHVYKEEPIAGRPVHMGGSIVPQTAFEESMALSGRPVSAVHVATERAPTEHTSKIYFGE